MSGVMTSLIHSGAVPPNEERTLMQPGMPEVCSSTRRAISLEESL
jgi:hypothetical protein